MDNSYTNQPKWAEQLTQKYASGIAHAFILHGNTADYAVPGMTVQGYLAGMAKTEIFAVYDISEGFSFPLGAEHKNAFMRALELDAAANGAEAQRAGLTGKADGPRRHDVTTALMLITRLLRMAGDEELKKAVVVVQNANLLFSGNDKHIDLATAINWGRDQRIINSGNILILVTGALSDIPAELRSASSRFEAISVEMPDYEQRLGFISAYLDGLEIAQGVDFAALAKATAGLQLLHIEDVFLRAQMIGHLNLSDVAERKAEIIKSEFDDVLELWEPRLTFEDIGGLEHIKNYFQKNIIQPMRAGGAERKRVPMGVLLGGPAGTGKSVMVEAVANECGLNVALLNPAKIFDMWVGSTERNMERLISALKALSPLIVFMDEIDQKTQRGESGDGGTGKRFFGALLEFMADTNHRGEVLFLAATNRPDLIDPALKRPGRFDRIVAFLMPNVSERASIVQVMSRRYAGVKLEHVAMHAVAEKTEGWSGAELESAAVKALELQANEDLDYAAAYVEATQRLLPNTQDVEFMTNLVLAEINDLDLLPPDYKSQALKARQAQQAQAEQEQAQTGRRGGRSF